MSGKELSPEQLERLARLAALPDDRIDMADIPEAPVENWAYARRGALDRLPLQHEVTLPLDVDVLVWFRQHAEEGESYEAAINRVLRRHVAEALEKDRASAVPAPAA